MTISISAHLPQGIPNGIGYKDLHRLACFLVEKISSRLNGHEGRKANLGKDTPLHNAMLDV